LLFVSKLDFPILLKVPYSHISIIFDGLLILIALLLTKKGCVVFLLL